MTLRRFVAWTALCVVLSTSAANFAAGDEARFGISVAAGKHDRRQTPVSVPLDLPPSLAAAANVALVDAAGKPVPAQLTAPGLLASDKPSAAGLVVRELHFILAEAKAGQSADFTATISSAAAGQSPAAWYDTAGEFIELRHNTRPVLRYMYTPYDESSKERRDLTYKVFHHLFSPDGSRLVTKGDGGQYPHHRGLYYGFNKISYGEGKKADTWHCTGDTHQSHAGFLASEAGPVLGRHRLAINWHGEAKAVFAKEEREMTAYQVPGGQLIEFASRLSSTVGPVKLDGDPQHAGFQFRADNEVAAKTPKQTYYLRPTGKGELGATKNWPADKDQVNLPWNVMSFVLGDDRYSAVYLDKPTNPKEARYSERDYGRFGSYFEYAIDTDKPLELNYRLWLQRGELTAADAATLSAAFVEPPVATAKKL